MRRFTIEDDFDLHAPAGLDYRHVTALHPIYNDSWNAQAKARWREEHELEQVKLRPPAKRGAAAVAGVAGELQVLPVLS